MPRICKDGRIWGQNNKEAGEHLGILSGRIRNSYDPNMYWNNKEINLREQKESRNRIKLEAFINYSGQNPPICARCGIDDIDVLCLDHINGNGAEDRRLHKNIGKALYFYLKREGYPEGYQVLCRNCNWKKRMTEDLKNAI